MIDETIQVPIDLIRSENIVAIKRLLPESDNLGRFAHHKEYGRVLIISHRPNEEQEFLCALAENPDDSPRADSRYIRQDELEFEPYHRPEILITNEEFASVPVGSVIQCGHEVVFRHENGWLRFSSAERVYVSEMKTIARSNRKDWKVLKWAGGE